MSDIEAYDYQKRVSQFLLSGRSVILQAPTGAGKTRAALLPYLHARAHLDPDTFPRKCLYSVPMRVLANQFNEEYRKVVQTYGWQRNLAVNIQTGDRPDDRQVEGDLVFATIDQTLSNFLGIPYALGGGASNLNVGAVLSSYLVFDEFHLYDPDVMLPTALEMLRQLRDVTLFAIMTATFSMAMLERLGELLGATVVPEDDDRRRELLNVGTQVGKQRVFNALDQPLTAEAVLARRGRRTLCICNTVHAAQTLYETLHEELLHRNDGTELHLLHSHYFRADRDAVEGWVRDKANFGQGQAEYDGPPLILVATQVVEVGLDMTCDVLHTELAPAASLLQRAGRCARFANEQGEVYVYLPRDENGEPDFTPYFIKRQAHKTERGRRLCAATWDALTTPDAGFTGQHMSFLREQALIDAVHRPIDEEILEQVAAGRGIRRDQMAHAMQTGDRSLAAELIRDIDTRFLLIHPQPERDEQLARNPWYYEGFALRPGTLSRAYKELDESGIGEAPWIMQRVSTVGDRSEESPARIPPQYRWTYLKTAGEVYSAPVVAIHPTLVRYDPAVGLRFGLSDGNISLRRRSGQERHADYAYRHETYAEHAAGLYHAYCRPTVDAARGVRRLSLRDEVAYCVRRLESLPRFGLQLDDLDRVARALFAAHDLGKLNTAWQKWAHDWQRQVGRFHGGVDMSLPAGYMAAHTDYDASKEQKEAQKKLGKRPHHAGESAMAAANLLLGVCGENEPLWRASLTAIARHHHAATAGYSAFTAHPAAAEAFAAALAAVDLDQGLAAEAWWSPDGVEDLSGLLVEFDLRRAEAVWLYFLLVRILRLADQRSQERSE